MKTQKQIENCLSSELSNLVSEFKSGTLTEDDLYMYFSTMLIGAEVDSKIIINVLEQKQFGDLGRHQALSIKVNEGW